MGFSDVFPLPNFKKRLHLRILGFFGGWIFDSIQDLEIWMHQKFASVRILFTPSLPFSSSSASSLPSSSWTIRRHPHALTWGDSLREFAGNHVISEAKRKKINIQFSWKIGVGPIPHPQLSTLWREVSFLSSDSTHLWRNCFGLCLLLLLWEG